MGIPSSYYADAEVPATVVEEVEAIIEADATEETAEDAECPECNEESCDDCENQR